MFSMVDPGHLQVLVFSSRSKTISAGSFVFKKGANKAAGYLVLSGRGVVRNGNSTSLPAIARVERGAFLGELSMIGKVTPATSVQAVSDMKVLELTLKMFLRVTEEFPDVGFKVLAVLSGKLDGSIKRLTDVQGYFDNARDFSRS